MIGALLGIIGNQVVARYKLIVGRRITSATLLADAKHSWLDAIIIEHLASPSASTLTHACARLSPPGRGAPR